jgi:hypothetical protein
VTLTVLAVCYVVSLPVVAYGIYDLARVPERLYRYTSYARWSWITALVAGYACLGLGGIVMTLVWFSSAERADVREDLVLDARWDHPAFSVGTATRGERRRERERRRRHRYAAVAISLPVVLTVAAVTAARVR